MRGEKEEEEEKEERHRVESNELHAAAAERREESKRGEWIEQWGERGEWMESESGEVNCLFVRVCCARRVRYFEIAANANPLKGMQELQRHCGERNYFSKDFCVLFKCFVNIYFPGAFAPGPPPAAAPAFFSAGFRIWKEHIRVSSTDIIAPALSNSPHYREQTNK